MSSSRLALLSAACSGALNYCGNGARPIDRNLGQLRGRLTASSTDATSTAGGLLVDHGDLPGLHRVLTGLDRDSIEIARSVADGRATPPR
jgi:hypothetical protein